MDQREEHPGDRAGGVSPAVHPPPVPAQHVRQQHARAQRAHDPDEHLVDGLRGESDADPQNDEQRGGEVARIDQLPLRRARVDVFVVDVLDYVTRAAVHRRVESRQEAGEQSSDRESPQAGGEHLLDY